MKTANDGRSDVFADVSPGSCVGSTTVPSYVVKSTTDDEVVTSVSVNTKKR